MARAAGAVTIDFSEEYVYERLLELTGGIGPDISVDAVGMEAHGWSLDGIYDKIKAMTMLETDRPKVIRQAIHCCRKGGTVSIIGVYGGVSGKNPTGGPMKKGAHQ